MIKPAEQLTCMHMQGYYKDAKDEVSHKAEAAKSWFGGKKGEAKLAGIRVLAQKC